MCVNVHVRMCGHLRVLTRLLTPDVVTDSQICWLDDGELVFERLFVWASECGSHAQTQTR
jgi:hypothetical protein